MIQVRPANARGHFDHGWLQTYHTFSFADYYDPEHMGFRSLRVINQDTVAPGQGFGRHHHEDMEIITFVMRGAVTHQDSMGNKEQIKAGEIQCMSAGSGVEHAEFNESRTEPLELLQIWIIPEVFDIKPSYQQMTYQRNPSTIQLLVSPDGEKNSLKIHQNAKIFLHNLTTDEQRDIQIAKDHYVWIQIVHGEIIVNNVILKAGDGAAISQENLLHLACNQAAELLLFDLV